jgi:hypothetical protein
MSTAGTTLRYLHITDIPYLQTVCEGKEDRTSGLTWQADVLLFLFLSTVVAPIQCFKPVVLPAGHFPADPKARPAEPLLPLLSMMHVVRRPQCPMTGGANSVLGWATQGAMTGTYQHRRRR